MAEDTVQAYLTKHKISSLFEELMSKVVKELPPDPLDFLIKKLQILHRQRNKGSPHVPSIGPSKASRGRMEVTGTSAVSKSPSDAKSPVSDRLSKSTSGLRPIKPKSSLSASSSASSLSKTTPTRPHTTTSSTSRPAIGSGTSKIPSPGKTRTASSKPPASRPSPSTSRIPSASKTRPATAPVAAGKPSPGTPSAGRSKGVTKPSAIPKKSHIKTATPPGTKTGLPSGRLASSSTSSVGSVSKKEPPVAGREVSVPKSLQGHEAKSEEIADFFGEPKKSSQRQYFVDSDEEEEEEEEGVGRGTRVRTDNDSVSDDEGMVDHMTESKHDSGINIQQIIAERRRKHARKSRGANLRLLPPISNSSAPLSLGYDDETESGDSEEGGVELMEDPDTLRDEGVEVRRSSHTITKSLVCVEPEEVALCAWCARALDVSGEGSGVTGAEFESISQQDTHSDPQWGSEELVSAGRDLETLSDVTLESHDTWGGLAPAPPQPELSEEESEIQLPPPPPLQGQSWIPESAPRDSHGWGQQQED